MKILSYGIINPKHLKCKGCYAHIEYTPVDVKSHSNKFNTYYYIPCPVCGKWCFVSKEGDSKK